MQVAPSADLQVLPRVHWGGGGMQNQPQLRTSGLNCRSKCIVDSECLAQLLVHRKYPSNRDLSTER